MLNTVALPFCFIGLVIVTWAFHKDTGPSGKDADGINDDDDIDFDEGYQGNIQYAIVQKDPDALSPQGSNDPRGIEANSSDEDFVTQTIAVLSNITIVGSAANNGDSAQPGMRLRGALTVSIF